MEHGYRARHYGAAWRANGRSCMSKQAEVINLYRRRIRRARNTVRVHTMYRLEGELALALVLRLIERLQHDLDTAVREFRELRQRKKVG